MKEIMDILSKMTDEEMTDEEKIHFSLLTECMEADENKINTLGHIIDAYAQKKNFTPFEISSLCCSIIMSVCAYRAKAEGVEYATHFSDRLIDTLQKGIREVIKEEGGKGESNSEDGNCSC